MNAIAEYAIIAAVSLDGPAQEFTLTCGHTVVRVIAAGIGDKQHCPKCAAAFQAELRESLREKRIEALADARLKLVGRSTASMRRALAHLLGVRNPDAIHNCMIAKLNQQIDDAARLMELAAREEQE